MNSLLSLIWNDINDLTEMADNEQMDGEKQEYTSIKHHVTGYEIWHSRNLPSEYLRSYTCFQEEFIFKQELHDIICHAILPAQLLDYGGGM